MDGISNPFEVEAIVDTEGPEVDKIADKKLRTWIGKAIKGGALRPVFETVVQRTTRTVRTQGGELELAVDDGELRAGDAKADSARGRTGAQVGQRRSAAVRRRKTIRLS